MGFADNHFNNTELTRSPGEFSDRRGLFDRRMTDYLNQSPLNLYQKSDYDRRVSERRRNPDRRSSIRLRIT